ncbi:MAG TPA: peptidylprolyl isomerase [Chitinophagaceae bacterium]|nr:peptidylprolyl isomerase [Chitinophagaceae bacterium]
MKKILSLVLLLSLAQSLWSQKQSIVQMKAGLEAAANPVAYAREVLKKQYKIDTVIILNSSHFSGIVDSLAYHAKIKKVYGPYEKKYLVQVLAKLPNTFTRVSQVFIDTSLFTRRIADSLANSIVDRVKTGAASFEDMAQTYSMGGEGATRGDLGWIARGSIIPEIGKELAKRKKGEVFKVWTKAGVHVIKKASDPKEDTGFALMLRVII